MPSPPATAVPTLHQLSTPVEAGAVREWERDAKNVEADKERCCICLMALDDRTAVGCGHQFCVSLVYGWWPVVVMVAFQLAGLPLAQARGWLAATVASCEPRLAAPWPWLQCVSR